MVFIRSPSSKLPLNTPEKTKTKADTSSSAEKSSVWKDVGQKVIAVIRCMVRNHMPLLLLLFVNNGYAQVIISTQVARQIPSVKLVGLVMAVFSVTEVVVSLGLTSIADKAGHRLMGLIGVLAEIIACVATCVMNEKQGGWVYVPPVLFAIMDTIYQTEVGCHGHLLCSACPSSDGISLTNWKMLRRPIVWCKALGAAFVLS